MADEYLGYIAGDTVSYSWVFHDDNNTPANSASSVVARLRKPDNSVVLLDNTVPIIDSQTGWYGSFVDTTDFDNGDYDVWMVANVSGHTVSVVCRRFKISTGAKLSNLDANWQAIRAFCRGDVTITVGGEWQFWNEAGDAILFRFTPDADGREVFTGAP